MIPAAELWRMCPECCGRGESSRYEDEDPRRCWDCSGSGWVAGPEPEITPDDLDYEDEDGCIAALEKVKLDGNLRQLPGDQHEAPRQP